MQDPTHEDLTATLIQFHSMRTLLRRMLPFATDVTLATLAEDAASYKAPHGHASAPETITKTAQSKDPLTSMPRVVCKTAPDVDNSSAAVLPPVAVDTAPTDTKISSITNLVTGVDYNSYDKAFSAVFAASSTPKTASEIVAALKGSLVNGKSVDVFSMGTPLRRTKVLASLSKKSKGKQNLWCLIDDLSKFNEASAKPAAKPKTVAPLPTEKKVAVSVHKAEDGAPESANDPIALEVKQRLGLSIPAIGFMFTSPADLLTSLLRIKDPITLIDACEIAASRKWTLKGKTVVTEHIREVAHDLCERKSLFRVGEDSRHMGRPRMLFSTKETLATTSQSSQTPVTTSPSRALTDKSGLALPPVRNIAPNTLARTIGEILEKSAKPMSCEQIQAELLKLDSSYPLDVRNASIGLITGEISKYVRRLFLAHWRADKSHNEYSYIGPKKSATGTVPVSANATSVPTSSTSEASAKPTASV